jgi:hypothetical protein
MIDDNTFISNLPLIFPLINWFKKFIAYLKLLLHFTEYLLKHFGMLIYLYLTLVIPLPH